MSRLIRRSIATAITAALISPTTAHAATQASQFAAACASCHRPDRSGSAIPPVAGLNETLIVQRMLAYRAAEPGSQTVSQIMQVVATALTPDEIAQVAHYLAAQPAPANHP